MTFVEIARVTLRALLGRRRTILMLLLAAIPILVGVGSNQQPEQDGHKREQDHQQRPAPAGQRAERDADERRDDRHRRVTR